MLSPSPLVSDFDFTFTSVLSFRVCVWDYVLTTKQTRKFFFLCLHKAVKWEKKTCSAQKHWILLYIFFIHFCLFIFYLCATLGIYLEWKRMGSLDEYLSGNMAAHKGRSVDWIDMAHLGDRSRPHILHSLKQLTFPFNWCFCSVIFVRISRFQVQKSRSYLGLVHKMKTVTHIISNPSIFS